MDIYDRLTPIFRQILSQEDLRVSPELQAKDVPTWDSLAHINLIVALEDAFGLQFTVDELMGMRRVADLVSILERHGKVAPVRQASAMEDIGRLLGQQRTETVRIVEADVGAFGALVGDMAPVHFDAAHARSLGYRDRIAHGLYVAARFSRILGMQLPGPRSVIHSVKLDFVRPVYIDTSVTFSVRVAEIRANVGIVRLTLHAADENGSELARGSAQCGFPIDSGTSWDTSGAATPNA